MIETIFVRDEYYLLPGGVIARVIAGVILAPSVAWLARRAGLLGRSGLAAASLCGALCVIAGWDWATLLVVYFAAAALLSRAGRDTKASLTGGVVSKGDRRDWVQVVANGGLYSLAAALTIIFPSPYVVCGAMGALAASSADTWATELGISLGGAPRLITTRTIVRKGESGGVTGIGLLGSAAGAAWVALVALLLGFSNGLAIASLVAGFGGSITDSLLGATIQERRWCDDCAEPTERAVHLCGSATRRVGGIIHIDNDVVNLLSTFAGFLLAVIACCIVRKLGSWGAIG